MRTLWTTSERASAHFPVPARLLLAGLVVAVAAATAACSSSDVAARERQMYAATGAQTTGMMAPGMVPAGINTGMTAAMPSAAGAAVPGGVVVTCPPGTQAVITPPVAGQTVSQVSCTPDPSVVTYQPAAVPAAYGTYGAPVATPAVVRTTEPVRERVVYRQPRTTTARAERAQSGRSWKKSAIIIGSSAGVGAGVGAAVGGKKGALIGAAIGGGGAAIWDQATRK
ncbi:MAG: hypothetical protein KJ061_15050 [Vicinamibacteraceae bacterium]|nr:hypothetical protein [Vicinamibacteraceae bacterium]